MSETPRDEYAQRLALRRSASERLGRRERRLSTARLIVFLLGVALAVAVFAWKHLPATWLVLPAGAFVALVVRHDRAIQARSRAERAAAFYERALARLGRSAHDAPAAAHGGRRDTRPPDAPALGASGESFLAPDHLYAADLDLFGPGSLFALLCAARTRAGEETLAGWLCAPAAPEEVRARQQAVEELRSRLDLREDLALLGEDVRVGLAPDALAAWATAPAVGAPRGLRIAIALAAGLVVASLAATLLGAPTLPLLLATGAIAFALAATQRRRVRAIVTGVGRPGRDLALLAALLARIEAERFASPRLVAVRAALDTGGVPASRRVARLRLLVDLVDARRNQLFAPIAAATLWTTQLALAIESWRHELGPAVVRWLAAAGELEALCSLATFAYERPASSFPAIVEGELLFDAEELVHPLLPADRAVPNDVRLDAGLRLLLVSGSNMSGKSTLLRSVGVNAVLALAGAPVCARRLRLSPFSLGASIRVHDSLQEGASRFYAEITRLGQIVRRAENEPPLLFLLDEMLAGTSSHDRRIGASAIVRGLVARGALGLVTTHDLALAKIADELAPRAANVHFEDRLRDGQMQFDYRLRPGVVTHSNALELMRAVGLDLLEGPGPRDGTVADRPNARP